MPDSPRTRLRLLPSPSQPVTKDRGSAELAEIWNALDRDGRRMLLAHARAVAEVTGRLPKPGEPLN